MRCIHLFTFILTVAFLGSCSREPAELVLSGPTMGTTYNIKIVRSKSGVDARVVRQTIDAVLATIDKEMSTYRPDSDISTFNAAQSTEWIEVAEGLATVVAAAQRVSERSDGAFDITVAPLVQAWGFGASGEPQALPSDTELAALRENVGYRLLDVRLKPAALRKTHPALTIDVNGVAPGYAVDVLAMRFEALGLHDFMIDIGGEVLARGRNASSAPWRIAVERPEDTDPQPFTIVDLDNRSVTTSGEYRHYFMRDGERYSHTIDPRSGHPIKNQGSVVVVGATSLEIDAWATALNVLGPEAGLELAEREQLQAMYLVVRGEDIDERASSAFKANVRTHPVASK